MYKCVFALVFTNLILIIYANDPVTLRLNKYIVKSTETAKIYLAKIQPEEVLPVILFEKPSSTSDENPFDFPETIDTALIFNSSTTVDGIEVEGRKMLTGTSFSAANPNIVPTFYCPKQNSDEICLVPQYFSYYHRLVCPVQPIPTVSTHERDSCAPSNDKKTLNYPLGYAICEAPGRNWKTISAVYYVCYDKLNQKNLYTSHYIMSPKLLDSFLLHQEQQLEYPISGNQYVPIATQSDIINHLQAWNAWEVRSPGSSQIKPTYRVQKLAPSKDFALGSWIKTTYQLVNMELQHESLYEHWNDLAYLVRAQAIVDYKNDIEFYIRTGVFDLDADVLPNDGQKYNIWVKVVTSVRRGTKYILQGVVFIANNFITEDPEIEEKKFYYCGVSACAAHYKSRMEFKVLCCKMNQTIARLFPPGVIIPDLEVLEIKGLNEPPH